MYVLSKVLARRGISHNQSWSDPNFANIWEIIDGRSVPVLQVNLVDGSFLEMPHYPLLETKIKIKLADAEAEYHRRFKAWYKISCCANISL